MSEKCRYNKRVLFLKDIKNNMHFEHKSDKEKY